MKIARSSPPTKRYAHLSDSSFRLCWLVEVCKLQNLLQIGDTPGFDLIWLMAAEGRSQFRITIERLVTIRLHTSLKRIFRTNYLSLTNWYLVVILLVSYWYPIGMIQMVSHWKRRPISTAGSLEQDVNLKSFSFLFVRHQQLTEELQQTLSTRESL